MAPEWIDLNQASRDELMQIEGVGEKMADEIVTYRDQRGGFQNVDELEELPSFAGTMVDKMKESVHL
jgi:competence protein ComEA